MSSLRNSRYSPNAASAPRLLSLDQLNGPGYSTTQSAFCLNQSFQGEASSWILSTQTISKLRYQERARNDLMQVSTSPRLAMEGMTIETRPLVLTRRRRRYTPGAA